MMWKPAGFHILLQYSDTVVYSLIVLIKKEGYRLVKLLESLLKSGIIFSKNDSQEIQLSVHLSFGSLDYILVAVRRQV